MKFFAVNNRKTVGERVFTIASYIVITIFALTIFLPMLYILQMTFSATADTMFRIWPKNFTLEHYGFVFAHKLIQRPFANSAFLTIVGTLYSMALTILMAYPLSRKEMMGRKQINFIVMLPMLISLGFMPSYLLIRDLKLIDSYWALILPGAVNTFNLIVVRNFFQTIPDSLLESARIDGAGEFRILVQIVLPLSKAAIACVSLFYMVSNWNDYFNVVLYINNIEKRTLQVVLRMLIFSSQSASELGNTGNSIDNLLNIQYTAIVIAILPVMAVYPFLQRYFVQGVLVGSVKA